MLALNGRFPERAFLAQLEERLAEGNQVEVEVSLILLAGRGVDVDEDELRAARRRAVQLLAAGGDPRRELDPEGRAVTALAGDLDTPARQSRARIRPGSLRPRVDGLPDVSARLDRLPRTTSSRGAGYACTLLGEELVRTEPSRSLQSRSFGSGFRG